MTAATNAQFDAAAVAPAVGVVLLVEMDFTGGTVRYTNWPHDVVVGGNTYTGLGNLGSVGALKESEDGQMQTVDLELSQVSANNLGLALGSVSGYQGRAVRIYTALTDVNFVLTGAPVLRFSGWMNVVKIRREDGNVGRVIMQCATAGYDLRRNPAALRMNDTQHQSRFPGERGFEYVADLIARPQMWLSKRFQAA